MKFFKFKKTNVVSLINFTGIIAPNMGRKKGLNIQDYNKLIEQAFQNKRNKAVVLVINSPGGSPVQSEFLADRIINLSKENPKDPSVWYELAEAQGLAGNIIGLHRSRAEYFILTGRYDSAIFQLREGLKLSKNFFEIRESIINKLEQIYKTKRALKDLT